jgi:hypothetical protein
MLMAWPVIDIGGMAEWLDCVTREIVGKEVKEVANINLYRPADFDGKVLQLHYTRAEELDPYLKMVAAQGGEVYVQFWLRPWEAPVEVSLNDEGAGGDDTGGIENLLIKR